MFKDFNRLAAYLLGITLALSAVFAPIVVKASNDVDSFVFLIHGVGGNKSSFGAMEEALTRHLNDDQTLGKVQVMTFEYPTSISHLTTEDFAKLFDSYIYKALRENGKESSTINIVAHSQGGIVATTWFYRAYTAEKDYTKSLTQRVRSVVTLGTPFWGSKVATGIIDYLSLFNLIKEHFGSSLGPLGAIGERQIKDLALGSDSNQEFRRNVLGFDKEEMESIFSQIRLLNIEGNANLKRLTSDDRVCAEIQKKYKSKINPRIFDFLLNFVFGLVEYESDSMVLVPDGSLNNIYLTDLSTDYGNQTWIAADNFNELKVADRLVVQTVHASLEPEILYDLTYIPEICLVNRDCDHPTYKHILNYLSINTEYKINSQNPSSRIIGKGEIKSVGEVKLHNFGGFTLAVNVRVPQELSHLRDLIKVNVEPVRTNEQMKNERKMTPVVLVNRPSELYSHIKQVSKLYPDSTLHWFTGHIKFTDLKTENYDELFRSEGTTLKIRIQAPGMKTRKIIARVKPMLATNIDVMLAPQGGN